MTSKTKQSTSKKKQRATTQKKRSFAPPRTKLRAFAHTEPPEEKHDMFMIEKHDPTDQNFFRAWRLYKGVRMQKDLAAMTVGVDPLKVGLDRVTICRLETGEMQYNETHIKLLSLALRVAPHDLVGTNPNANGEIKKILADLPVNDRGDLKKIHAAIEAEMMRKKAKVNAKR